MRKNTFTLQALLVAALAAPASLVHAEDIDLFLTGANSDNPNVLIVIDNSANWSAANQGWIGANGESPFKQGQSELRAVRTLALKVTADVNLGLMLFRGGDVDGTYIRYAVRTMTDANKTAFAELIGDASCVDGLGTTVNLTPKCIFKNFDGVEKTATADLDYGAAMFEVFKYFGGCTSPAFAHTGICKTSPLGRNHFGKARHSGDFPLSSTTARFYDQAAYTDFTRNTYIPPAGTANSCAKNYVIFIGNGFPKSDVAGSPLSNVEGDTTQLAIPNVNDLTKPWAPPPANKARMADEWARYLSTTDVSDAPGLQNVQIYTIDVFKDQQDKDQTALLMAMAKHGNGLYFQASSEEAILEALERILIDIKAFNSVFASASLPINATNRSQSENQVFIGMFRPDPGARPRWYGNLKRYQIAKFGQDTFGNDVFKLADASNPPQEAVSTTGGRGFIQPCAKSFWTTDTTAFDKSTSPATDLSYWNFPSGAGSHIGTCTVSSTSPYSDSPDGPQVEKGAAAQVVRLGNLANTTPDFREHRTMYTCRNNSGVSCNVSPNAMHDFDKSNVSQAAVGAVASTEHENIIEFTRGVDVLDDNSRLTNTDVRPSVHGDVAHSRPVPVNYGSPNGVVLYYGANDGAFRAVSGETGKELWAFIAPEHHGKLKRLYENGVFGDGLISYPPTPATGSMPKDYFFDGSAGLFQTADEPAVDRKVWIFPSMRRGGRMLYAFDVTTPTAPRMKWRLGCTNSALTDTASCINSAGASSSEFAQMGQTWSTPTVALIKNTPSDPGLSRTVVIAGGGYDTCDDQDAKPNTACTAPGYTRRGNRVFVIDADTGSRLASFTTDGSVPADITVIDRDFDGLVDHAYAADTRGGIYRIDFVDPGTLAPRAPAAWTITKIAQTNALDARKFLFSPAALPAAGKVYLTIASGDRERPLIINYPYPVVSGAGVLNRAYMLVDLFATTGLPVNLDDTTVMEDFSSGSTCTTPSAEALGKKGWFINLNAASTTGPSTNVGEQGVTSSIIFGGLIFFSTNRPVPTDPGACAQDLGEARGYVLNLLNASGAADTTLSICGGARSNTFEGGGLPPSPVTGTVPVDGQPVTIMIGAVQRDGGKSSSIGAQRATPTITQRRTRLYWYNDTDK